MEPFRAGLDRNAPSGPGICQSRMPTQGTPPAAGIRRIRNPRRPARPGGRLLGVSGADELLERVEVPQRLEELALARPLLEVGSGGDGQLERRQRAVALLRHRVAAGEVEQRLHLEEKPLADQVNTVDHLGILVGERLCTLDMSQTELGSA